MGAVDQEFFLGFGQRITALRKAKGLTQGNLAETLGFTQQQIHLFEKGRRRVPISLLPTLAKHLDVTLEELLGVKPVTTKKRGPSSKLEKQFSAISALPKNRQKFVSEVIEAVLKQSA